MATKQKLEAQNPLILRCSRLIEAFGKSDDERDFYIDRQEGFLIYIDQDKAEEDLQALEKELEKHPERYCLIPKLTFYETKKIMEGFINEKVYDIDTKEKLLDIIQSKDARQNFLEFIYDHHAELEKWQTYYQERSRIRIIEWLRTNHFHFVFEEDLEFPKSLLEKIKQELFATKVGKDIANARKTIITKSKTYYSNEALNPRPKRGRPPKQILKTEIEPLTSSDIYTTVPPSMRSFLYNPEMNVPTSLTSKFGYESDLFSSRRTNSGDNDLSMDNINQKLAELRNLSTKWKEAEDIKKKLDSPLYQDRSPTINGNSNSQKNSREIPAAIPSKASLPKSSSTKGKAKTAIKTPKASKKEKLPQKRKIMPKSPKSAVKSKPVLKTKPTKPKAVPKAPTRKRLKNLRPIKKLRRKGERKA